MGGGVLGARQAKQGIAPFMSNSSKENHVSPT